MSGRELTTTECIDEAIRRMEDFDGNDDADEAWTWVLAALGMARTAITEQPNRRVEDVFKHAAMLVCPNCDRQHPKLLPLFGWAHVAPSGVEIICTAERIWMHLATLRAKETG